MHHILWKYTVLFYTVLLLSFWNLFLLYYCDVFPYWFLQDFSCYHWFSIFNNPLLLMCSGICQPRGKVCTIYLHRNMVGRWRWPSEVHHRRRCYNFNLGLCCSLQGIQTFICCILHIFHNIKEFEILYEKSILSQLSLTVQFYSIQYTQVYLLS